ncbi:MAG TPA: FAD-binding oxidoreductase, partial [Allosphingosinicella sp.]
EAEEALGRHSSGRSVTFSHYGIGDAAVRGLTSYSRAFFLDPPAAFSDEPIARTASALFVATEEMLPTLHALQAQMERFTNSISYVGEAEIRALCPVLKTGEGAMVSGVVETAGLRLDADALLQGFARAVRTSGGEIHMGKRIARLAHARGEWEAETEAGERFSAPILINAAGAWADGVAALAGVRPLGLTPRRRTIIVVDPPRGENVRDWPFVKTAADLFYMLPEAGRLLASPVDEVVSEPCDAQPEDYDLALAAHRLEEYTSLSVRRIAHRWAGLRTFTSDRVPTAGFAPDAPGFFWLAGQGGYGLQTAPAMAEITEALITGAAWPAGLAALGVAPEQIRPERLLRNS